MTRVERVAGLRPALWTAVLVVVTVGAVLLTLLVFNRDLQPYANVLLASERAGLMMEPHAKVKYRGVQVGRVASIQPKDSVELRLELYPAQLKYIPENVEAEIAVSTAFGAKFVELLPPEDPAGGNLRSGMVLHARNVTTEVNTVFENLVDVLNQIDTAKLNAVLTALSEGFRGTGEQIGEAITGLDEVLRELNPRNETIRSNYRAIAEVADIYSGAAGDVIEVLDAATATSTTITEHASDLEILLLNVIGVSTSGVNLIGPHRENLVDGINVLESTTRLLMKYQPSITCTIVGGKVVLDSGLTEVLGGNGRTAILDAGILLGDEPYKYPEHLPINGIKGGPGGTPSCGSLPDVSENWPVRYLVTDSGWGRGLDVRPNPGIGFPGYANYFPTTRGQAEPPSIRYPGGPAPGPVPYPGAPPYGAQLYAPDGTPLYPGLPPAPPPGRLREPGPPPAGSEPFVPAYPGTEPTSVPPAG
ncbi:MCE family protein [Mycobacterium sp. 1274756.6]|uniref:MCE family protein n=1 Tax=Mycobacterium sp. 1274756.6 TaxID=1834076 RepID=UPI0007FC12AB|nr:MCE family protein [Mycobacterium sp. 1274756.6]OBJ67830.1 MCE-family protein MCE3A [Mycobacterium sp. 1274756.6]